MQFGVPLIIFPGVVIERGYNARKVSEAGAGIMGKVDQFTVDWLRSSLDSLGDLAPHAKELGRRIRSYGGVTDAVEAILSWQ